MNLVELLLTPKDVALAIGTSESSLRRWIDSGDIRVSRTAGGHRRIPLSEAVRFIRQIGAVVVRPDLLHLPALPAEASGLEDADDAGRLFGALRDGHRELAGALVLSWYLSGKSLHWLFDGPVRSAMARLGELWLHDQRGILLEHRATDICLGILAMLRSILPAVDDAAPLAVGAAPQGDPYQIPTLMAATVLAEAGLRGVNFSADVPLELLADEAAAAGARLVWLSISAAGDPKPLRRQLAAMAQALAARNIDLIIGGSAAGRCNVPPLPHGIFMHSMGELAAYARGLLSRQADQGVRLRSSAQPQTGPAGDGA